MRVTAAMLYAIAPGADGKIVSGIVDNASRLSEITDPTELAYFMGQNAAETGGFTRLEENLYYTSTNRLRQVWPSRFKSDGDAKPFVRNPRLLANYVYGGRFGNIAGSSDGWDYRGSGLNQTTFRDNYTRVQLETGVRCVANPELLRSFPGALDAAVVYWRVHKLAAYAKRGDLIGLTKAIQGADGGLRDRKVFTDRALAFIKRPVTDKAPQAAPRADWLRKGASGPAVMSLQTKLKLAGYYVGGVLDGDFGDGTDNAVREFQRVNGLTVDGVLGEKTASTLDACINKQSLPPASLPQAGAGPVPATNALAALFAALARIISAIFNRGSKDGKK